MLQWDKSYDDLDHQPVINSVTFYSRICDNTCSCNTRTYKCRQVYTIDFFSIILIYIRCEWEKRTTLTQRSYNGNSAECNVWQKKQNKTERKQKEQNGKRDKAKTCEFCDGRETCISVSGRRLSVRYRIVVLVVMLGRHSAVTGRRRLLRRHCQLLQLLVQRPRLHAGGERRLRAVAVHQLNIRNTTRRTTDMH